ncbi:MULTISPECIES: hypothetical protein [unclassified Tenacibaculum]|nr:MULTISPECIES: hypothetical protein [unclassified Tenacibaculum]
MHVNLGKVAGAYMYTMLTGNCVLGNETTDKIQMNGKVGYLKNWS